MLGHHQEDMNSCLSSVFRKTNPQLPPTAMFCLLSSSHDSLCGKRKPLRFSPCLSFHVCVLKIPFLLNANQSIFLFLSTGVQTGVHFQPVSAISHECSPAFTVNPLIPPPSCLLVFLQITKTKPPVILAVAVALRNTL